MTWSVNASGHHNTKASSLLDAREKLAAYDAAAAGSGEDDGSTTEPEATS